MSAPRQTDGFVAALRACAPYVHSHRGRVLVLSLPGELIASEAFDALIYDIALLHALGLRIVLVHGARPQIDALMRERGVPVRMHGALRITDEAALACVQAAVGATRMQIEARLSTSLASTPMGGARIGVAAGNWIVARPLGVQQGVDLLHTGTVRRVAAEAIREQIDAGRITLVSPVGYSPTGEIFNLHAEEVATAIAGALRADKLALLAWQHALPEGLPGGGALTLAEARRLTASHDTPEPARALLHTAVAAAAAGTARVHIVPADIDGALLRELYTRDGCGLLVHADDDYEATRPATIDDIGGILALIAPLERDGTLVPRSREQLELDIERFIVMVRDGMVVGCCAVLPLAGSDAAELACLAVHPAYRRAGRASALLRRAEQRARELGLSRLFVLTTHTPHWFVEHGFARVGLDDLPVSRRELYNYRRNSLVFCKQL